MSARDIESQIKQAKDLCNRSWKDLSKEERDVSLQLVKTLEWIEKNGDTVKMAVEVKKHVDLMAFVQDAIDAQHAFPGSTIHIPTENDTE